MATVLSLHVVDETQQDALVTAVAACRAARRVSGRKVEGIIAGETKVEELRRRRRNQRRLVDLIDDLVSTFDRRSAFSTQRLEQELARRKPLCDIAPRYRGMMLDGALRFMAKRGRVVRLEGKGGGWRVAGEALRDQRGCRSPQDAVAESPAS